MRRIFKNTTAIAACLALLAPQMVAAQAAADADATVVPPAAEATPEVTPPEADASTEAPAAETTPEAEAATPEAEAAPAAEATEAPAAEGEPTLEEAMEAETSEAEAAVDGMTPESGDLDAAMQAEQAETTDPAMQAAEAEAETTPATDQQAAETPAAEEPAAEAPAAEEPAAEEPAAEEPAAQPEMTEEPVDEAPAEAEAATEADAPSADDLDAAMAAEQDAEAEANPKTTAATAGAASSDEATAESPAADTTSSEATADEATATTEEETPAADTPVQSSATEDAAQATPVPNVAALDDNATSEVTEEEVTEENSRSSSEDFATTMQEATSTEQQDAKKDDSDDDNDLTKAVLLGLGGVAVGAMLNNNRQVQLSTPDRVVVTRPDGTQELIKDDVALLRQPGSTVATENFEDGSSRTIVTRQDGSRVVTIRDADLRILRRTLVSADGTQTALIDETTAVDPVDVATLPQPAPAYENAGGDMDEASLREALMREADVDRRFSLAQIRDISQVRSLVAPIDVNGITFDTNSAAIDADQAKSLTALGNVIRSAIEENPNEIFLIEGHTDTVGEDAANLALSDRRAESVALALTEYFQVAPENMVVQGYGEQSPKVAKEGDVRENRRVAVRRITGLLQTAAK